MAVVNSVRLGRYQRNRMVTGKTKKEMIFLIGFGIRLCKAVIPEKGSTYS